MRRWSVVVLAAAMVAVLVPTLPPAPAAASTATASTARCLPTSGRSPLTGRAVTPAQARQPLVSVKVNNFPVRAWPQRGLAALDVNVVQEIEEGYTRHMAMFATRYPTAVGPVRSSRETDVELLHSFGNATSKVALAYSGAAQVVQKEIDASDRLIALTEGNAPHAYHRDRARTTRSGAQHALFARMGPHGSTLRNLAAKREAKAPRPQRWCFSTRAPGGKPVRSAEVRWPRQGVAARWDARAGRWGVEYTYPAGGRWRQTPAMDELANAPLRADNVVILLTSREVVRSARYRSHRADVPKTSTLGAGELILLRNGHAHLGTWQRRKAGSPLQLLDRAGAPLPLQPGTTWFLLAGQDRAVSVRRDGAPAVVSGTTSLSRQVPTGIRRELLRR